MYIYRVVNSLTLLSFCCHLRTREMCFICAMLDLAYIYAYIYIYRGFATNYANAAKSSFPPSASPTALLLLPPLRSARQARLGAADTMRYRIYIIYSICHATWGTHMCVYIYIYSLHVVCRVSV